MSAPFPRRTRAADDPVPSPRRDSPCAPTDPARRSALARLAAGLPWWVAACSGSGATATSATTSGTEVPAALLPPDAASATIPGLRRVDLRRDLRSPWGMAFLPGGGLLVTQKNGTILRLADDGRTLGTALAGVPEVVDAGQGGLLDIALDPDFARDPWVYWSYAEAGPGGSGTAVARGRLGATGFSDVAVIYRQTPKVSGNGHFGCRLVFRPDDKTLFITLGERQKDSPSNPGADWAQNTARTTGKVVRVNRDGSIPAGNPDFGTGAAPGLWSIGHRNPQGAAIRPGTNELWLVEHGPRGGDELNRVVPGANYGWPLRSYGCNYHHGQSAADCRPGGGRHAPEFTEPVMTFLPVSTAPSGLAFVTGSRYPEWQGHVLIGALAGQALWRVRLDGTVAVEREKLLPGIGRVRCVQIGPDGWIYLLTDDGLLARIER